MLHLVPQTDDPDQIVLAAQGRIAAEAVDLLAQEIEPHLKEDRRLVLDLDGVRFIDREGTERLRRWVADGLVLRGGSLFVRLLLRERGVLS